MPPFHATDAPSVSATNRKGQHGAPVVQNRGCVQRHGAAVYRRRAAANLQADAVCAAPDRNGLVHGVPLHVRSQPFADLAYRHQRPILLQDGRLVERNPRAV